jgi:hypothetical protein
MDNLSGAAGSPGPSWHADPLSSTPQLRWWSGDRWTAWVLASATDTAAIAWVPELVALPSPIQWGSPAVRLAVAPPLQITPLAEAPAPRPAAAATEPVVATPTPGDEDRQGPPPRRRRRRHLLVAAALVPVLAIAGVASAALLTTGPRPTLTDIRGYRDGPAGFSLTYPPGWKTQRVNPGQGIRFVVPASHASADQLTTVTVTVGTQRGPLPSPADLARTVVDGLQPQFPGITLTTSGTTTLAGGPAVTLTFTDAGTSPPTTVKQVVGRTADGRPLTVTVQVPDPGYAPNDSVLHTFLASITS